MRTCQLFLLRLQTAAFMSITALLLSLTSSATAARNSDPTIVQTDLGAARGIYRNGVLEFRGIPYAAPPSGDRRWAPPQPATPWTGVRDASNFGSACPQVARFGLTEASNDEDCLSINVSVPKGVKGGSKKPVFVWVHGGAFVGGSSNLYRLDALARSGVVAVTFNYRAGVFGFMPHPAFDAAYNGGYGLEDQRAALRWVQRNIAAFGGDPDNVTLAGESAGAGSICQHLASPEHVKGLFHKVVIQSAGCLQPMPTVKQAQQAGLTVAAAVGCKDAATALQCLRQAPLKALLDAGTAMAGDAVMAFAPTVGSQTVPRSMADAFKIGKVMKVPMLMGGTRDELRLYVAYDQQAGRKVTRENFMEKLRTLYGSTSEERQRQVPEQVARTYPLTGDINPPTLLGSIMSNFNPTVGINNCLYLHTADAFSRYVPVYEFEFADANAPVLGVGIPAQPDPGMELGAVHSSEINYLFPRYSNTSRIDAPELAPESQKLADQMVAYWTSFASTGVPAVPKSPAWPKYSKPNTVMLLEPGKTGLYNASQQHKCEFWKLMYPERLGPF